MSRRDEAAAGVVAAIIMLGAIVGFLAILNLTWVPTWIANKESVASSDMSLAMNAWADTASDHVARGLTNRTFSRGIPIGVSGLPVVGTGASSGEVAVESGPQLTVRVGATTYLSSGGALAATSHTVRYPNQTIRLTFGALEVRQEDGTWVDTRNLLRAERTATGKVALALQALTVTGAPQSAGTTGEVQVAGTITSVTTTTGPAGNVQIVGAGVSADAWRVALRRTLDGASLTRQDASDCSTVVNAHYCIDTDAAQNSGTRFEVWILNAASGWSAVTGTVEASVRR